jgi:hypothetical protein
MQVIQHQELASAQASITFSSIPQTYTDLYLVFSARSNYGAGTDALQISFNSNTSSYSSRLLYGTGTSAASTTIARYVGEIVPATYTANTFGNLSIYVPNYTSGSAKSYSADTVTENNATSAFQVITAGLWDNTAAITSIAFTTVSGSNFLQYTSATLYGILKGSDGIVTVS